MANGSNEAEVEGEADPRPSAAAIGNTTCHALPKKRAFHAQYFVTWDEQPDTRVFVRPDS